MSDTEPTPLEVLNELLEAFDKVIAEQNRPKGGQSCGPFNGDFEIALRYPSAMHDVKFWALRIRKAISVSGGTMTPDTPPRCCGDCAWGKMNEFHKHVDCLAPMADAFSLRTRLMWTTEGRTCPCWKVKDENR